MGIGALKAGRVFIGDAVVEVGLAGNSCERQVS